MNITSVLIAAGVVGIVGILAGILLGVASESFKVKVNETEIKVREALPGNNCGACGYPGCDGLAAAIAKGEAKPGSCPVGGEPVASAIAEIVGGNAEVVKVVANVRCKGDCEKAKEAYEYVGPKDCRIAANTPGGGPKGCAYGCLGFGSCKKACPFDAIDIVDGIAVIDKDKCRACEACVAVCPRHIIEIIPYDAGAVVECNSNDGGKEVKQVCQVGCIGCGICQKTCPVEAIKVENKLAHVDYDKCIGCGACKQKCPVKIIS
ncbi:MAG: RnfABCDGE type electron transport complex subunit B [Lachnospiraceae bacterium]|nr:RnfABCDGE type electron transport complex subunit B [Lachnospiraceae bacterium]